MSLVKKIITFRYLGLHLQENDSGITLDQMNYSENLKLFRKTENYSASNYDNESNSEDLLQSQIEKLLWISDQTRPDIAFDVCQLGTNFIYSDDKDIKYANKIIAHLKQELVQITHQNLGNECNLKLYICRCISWQFK